MTRRTRLYVTAAIVGVLSGSVVASDTTTLVPGATIERELTGGRQHVYRLALAAGEYARVIVEQRGVDVVVQLSAADASPIATFQHERRTRGPEDVEHVEIVADAGGTFTLTVSAALGKAPNGTYAIRLAGIRTATDDDRSMQEARRLHAASDALQRVGEYGTARPLVERALVISERVRGPNDADVAELIMELGEIARARREFAQAESLYTRALAVMEEVLGADHPLTAYAWSRLAQVYATTGRRPQAETLIQRAIGVTEKTLGPDHPQVALCLLVIGNLREDAADYEKAEEVDRRALAIVERSMGTDNVLFADLLNNVGVVYLAKSEYERAEPLLLRSLAIVEQLRGTDDIRVANLLQNLGVIARQRKHYAKAEEYYLRALSLRETVVGPEHPDVASNLTNLGNVYKATGDLARSLETHLRALAIWEHAQGPHGKGALLALGNLATTYAAADDVANAVRFQARVDAVIEAQLGLNLAIGSERQRLAFVRAMAERTDRTISLSLRAASRDPDASALAALVLLQRKGRVLDAMTDTLGTLRQRVGNADDRDLLDQLRNTRERLAQLALNGPKETPREEHLSAVTALEDRKEKLEAAISERSAEFRAQSQPVTIEAVQAALPGGSALVELAVFRHFDPRSATSSDAYGKPHYAAYVLGREAAPRGTDLGPAEEIDGAIDAFRLALRDPKRADVTQLARAVDEKVMAPIRAMLGGATRLLISPDGELNLIPFEALRDEQGRYLVERYAISYLSTGRDLLRLQVPRTSKRGPVIVADPLFGDPPAVDRPSPVVVTARALRRSVTAAEDLSSMYFAPLTGTSHEARAIKSLFVDATVLTRREATKAAIEALQAPSILHIATHGFFMEETTAGNTNPLLRSGLALAGANLHAGSRRDGILTASEASGLDLWGTRLVTLSACQTGVGDVKNGEGVYGLRRAVFLAGAETVVMSLWTVSDAVTREMMTAYYGGLRDGVGRGESLRRTQLAMLTHKNRRHPYYWASFIQAGEWANLDGQR